MSVATGRRPDGNVLLLNYADPEGVACNYYMSLLNETRREMAGTFSQIYIHLVFAVQDRDSMILPSWEEEFYKYTTGIVQNQKQKMLAINGMPDHVHLFLNTRPSCRISDLVREIKKSTNEWVNEKHVAKFKWQEGYGAFSHGHGSVSSVISYVMNQKGHHRHKTFQEEYLGFLKRFDIPFKDEYLFHWIK